MNKSTIRELDDALGFIAAAVRDKHIDLNSLLSERYADLKDAISDAESDVSKHTRHGLKRLTSLERRASKRLSNTACCVDSIAHKEPWKAMGCTVVGGLAAGFLLGRKIHTNGGCFFCR